MTPLLTAPDKLNARLTHAVPNAQNCAWLFAVEDFESLGVIELGEFLLLSMQDTAWIASDVDVNGHKATLGLAVVHVVVVRTEKEVCWINAEPIVAVVADEKSGPFAVSQKPRYAVSAHAPTAEFGAQIEETIAELVERCCPRPTLVRPAAVYLFPETFCEWGFGWHGVNSLTLDC